MISRVGSGLAILSTYYLFVKHAETKFIFLAKIDTLNLVYDLKRLSFVHES